MSRPEWEGRRCWNGMTQDRREHLRVTNRFDGVYGDRPDLCPREATVAVEFKDDEAPGPRLLCRRCAVLYLAGVQAP